jgi:acyl-CoA hydrolase
MEVGVHIETENLATGKRNHVASAYLIFVALDERGHPTPVPPVCPDSKSEKLRYQQAELRYRQRKDTREQERALDTAARDR